MRDSVFEGVLNDLPVNATNIVVTVAYSYRDGDGTHKGSVERIFPSKAEATFRRNVAKVEDAVKKAGKDAADAAALVRGLEERMHKRLNKLERKNDPDHADVS